MVAWTIAAILLLLLIRQVVTTSKAHRKINALNECIQYLFFSPEACDILRARFLTFLKSIENQDAVNLAMASHRAIEEMAVREESKFLAVNITKRVAMQSQASITDDSCITGAKEQAKATFVQVASLLREGKREQAKQFLKNRHERDK